MKLLMLYKNVKRFYLKQGDGSKLHSEKRTYVCYLFI